MDRLELEFKWTTASGEFDFVVNGKSVREWLGDPPQRVSGIGFLSGPKRDLFVDRLLGLAKDDIPSGRVRLYICSDCGDFDCGALTTRISFEKDHVVWSDFASESGIVELGMHQFTSVGPFTFDRRLYELALKPHSQQT